jgi:formylglycine-generating enzyme required for sulfatase activity
MSPTNCLLLGLLLCGCGGGVTPGVTVLEHDAATDSDAEAQAPVGCMDTRPATMVMLPEGYGIDSTEVTRCQYQVWLDSKPSTSAQDAPCSWNTDFTPWNIAGPASCAWPPEKYGDGPLMCVDWCDAFAYCKGLGKRLCGKIGAGMNPYDDYADAAKSQWFSACSSGGKYQYPYGNTYEKGTKCNDSDRKKDPMTNYAPVGSLPECQSPDSAYAGVYDLSGNVLEWEDSCDGSTSGEEYCSVRGGSIADGEFYASCGRQGALKRRESWYGVGFRCCSQ